MVDIALLDRSNFVKNGADRNELLANLYSSLPISNKSTVLEGSWKKNTNIQAHRNTETMYEMWDLWYDMETQIDR